MKKLILGAVAAAAALAGGSAMAQPYYGYHGDGYRAGVYVYQPAPYYAYGAYPGYGHRSYAWRDSDGDGVPDRAEWNRDRDHDGRPDQWDRYDNRRDWRWRHYHHHHHRYDRYDRYDRDDWRDDRW